MKSLQGGRPTAPSNQMIPRLLRKIDNMLLPHQPCFHNPHPTKLIYTIHKQLPPQGHDPTKTNTKTDIVTADQHNRRPRSQFPRPSPRRQITIKPREKKRTTNVDTIDKHSKRRRKPRMRMASGSAPSMGRKRPPTTPGPSTSSSSSLPDDR